MATLQVSRGDANEPPVTDTGGQGDSDEDQSLRERPSAWLLLALLLLILYAAFAHGDVGLPTEARVQVAITVLAALAAAAWLWTAAVRAAAPLAAYAGLGLLTAFAIWTGLTVLWSVAPDQTWLEFNRAISYVLVLGLAIAAGASIPRSIQTTARGFLAIASAVTLYAIGQKVLPGIHLDGVFNLNQTAAFPRLRAPLDYWNALALFIAFGVPIALTEVGDRSRSIRVRLAALLVLQLMIVAIGLTYSRGGLIALGAGLATAIAFAGGHRLWSLVLLAAAALAAVAPLVFGLSAHALTATGVSLGDREAAGGELAALLVGSLVLLGGVGRELFRLQERVEPDPQRGRAIGRALAVVCTIAIAAGLLVLALSPRGFTGSISHAWNTFTRSHGTSISDPNRLLSVNSGNRWVWWTEASRAFADRPLGGWGAGSFPVVHLLYRRDTLPVQQPHSVPLQFLAETGLVGTVLALGAFALLLVAAVGTVHRVRGAGARPLAAALLAGVVAYAVHALYDWDWDFPGVTFPALTFLGVLAGNRRWLVRRRTESGEGRPATVGSLPGPGFGARAAALAALALVLSLLAASATLPSLAQTKSHAALVQASGSSSAGLERALASAGLASRLDPLSDDGLKVSATIAVHQGHLSRARGYLIDAVRRDPTDASAWIQLAQVELGLGNSRDLVRAADRAFALDPRGGPARALAAAAYGFQAPPSGSATATGTPLPSG